MKLLDVARLALEEDFVTQDVTTASLDSFLKSRSEGLPESVEFYVGAKQAGVFSGRAWVEACFGLTGLQGGICLDEGAAFAVGAEILSARGPAEKILALERTLLNGLQYACGVATRTRTIVAAVNAAWAEAGIAAPVPGIYHTRKTPPLLRELAVQAALAGGALRHRVDLSDRILLKENHKYWILRQGLSLADYVQYLETWGFEDYLIEVETVAEAVEAARAGAKNLLLDNFPPADVRGALAALPKNLQIEVSGGLTLENVAEYCLPGVTRISVGGLTRDVRSIDLSLDWRIAR